MSTTDRNDQAQGANDPAENSLSRRAVLKSFGLGAAALGVAGVSNKGLGTLSNRRLTPLERGQAAGGSTLKIGYVSPETGALADFSQSDKYVLSKVRAAAAYAKGLKVGAHKYKVEITVADSQSDPNRAAQVAQQLVLQQKVDMIVTSSAPETTNPVAAACEQLRTPCLATVVPWESWYVGLGGDPLKPTKTFAYNAVFFFGMKEFAGTFLPMWNRIQKETKAAKVFAGMFPNDSDGNAFRAGFPPFAAKEGYKLVDGGAYSDGTTNYSSMIEKFKAAGCEFFVNAPLPPDFNTFWKQAIQENFRPKLATVAKVLLFPSDVIALGSLVNNIATDAWWTPWAPYKSSLTGESARDFAIGYQKQEGKEWVQSMGSAYSLFEVAVEAFMHSGDPHNKAAVAKALHNVSYSGLCGPIHFNKGPAPGVGIIYPVGIQWRPGKASADFGMKNPFQPFVVDNSLNKHVPINGELLPTNK
ncbi:MAG: ABC transporter substrate-binding protein [Actinomycetota bacterium]|nr:ABC transporter substrate-binding protein [Actinomycetota bacterium]